MPGPYTIVIVDDHPLFRAEVVRILSTQDEFEIVGEGSSVDEAIRLVRVHSPDIILLDISMPGDGVNAARQIAKLPNAPRIVMLTVSGEVRDLRRSLESGAAGYLSKEIRAGDLAEAVKRISGGDTVVGPNLSRELDIVKDQYKSRRLSGIPSTLYVTFNYAEQPK
jgi:DNA-binding NarL/FixJ family response regulator